MSLFYGVAATAANSSSTNSSSVSMFDKTVLPGHNFKDVYTTGCIVLVIVTMVALFLIALLGWKVPTIAEPKEPGSKITHKEHPTSGSGATCCFYIIYLLFELIIRICVELRLTVPFVFSAIEVPSRFFLMVADLLLLASTAINSEVIRKRLHLQNDALTYLSKPFLMIGGLAIVLVFFVERITYTIMAVNDSFRWDRPDTMYYAISRTVYAGGYLLLCALVWVRFVRMWIVYRMRVRSGCFTDRCGKVPLYLFAMVGPWMTMRAATSFCFTFFFRMMNRRQNPDLELLRMALVCLPLVMICTGNLLIRKQDLAIKTKEAEREYASDVNLLQPMYPMHKVGV